MKPFISGIQQVGIGVSNVQEAWKWYRQVFGMQIPVFEDSATASLMLPYTGGEPRNRYAVLALNPQGGSGMEIWQYTEREPLKPVFNIQIGDLGIFSTKIKVPEINKAADHFRGLGVTIIGDVSLDPEGMEHFFIRDPYDNVFEIIQSTSWFRKTGLPSGGPVGCTIGVTDMEQSIEFYNHILGYDQVIYDRDGKFEDLKVLAGGNRSFRRVLLCHKNPRKGAFSKFFGDSVIELVALQDQTARKIYDNRYWGDLGFIHVCFDIVGMDELRQRCQDFGHPFSVDSASEFENSFDMGEASGQFSYIEDPDGTLIEFVETHKIPISKKFGWYLDLTKRKPEKQLPAWIFKAMSVNRIKD